MNSDKCVLSSFILRFKDSSLAQSMCKTCPVMSSGPTIQDMSLGLYSLMLAFAKLAPSPDLLVNSCISLPEPVTYFYPPPVTFLPCQKKNMGREWNTWVTVLFFALWVSVEMLPNIGSSGITHSVTTNPGLGNCCQPRDPDWHLDSLIAVQLYNSLYSAAIQPAVEAEAFRRCLGTGCFNKSWTLWCKIVEVQSVYIIASL